MSTKHPSFEKLIQAYRGWILIGEDAPIKARFSDINELPILVSRVPPILVQASKMEEVDLHAILSDSPDRPLAIWWDTLQGLTVAQKDIVNRFHPDFHFFSLPNRAGDADRKQLGEVASLAIKRGLRLEQREELKRQYRLQDDLAQQLEAIVQDRTSHLQKAKAIEDMGVQNIQKLIRFIQGLAECNSVEQIFQKLRLDLRQAFEVYEVFFIEKSQEHYELKRLIGGDLIAEELPIEGMDPAGVHLFDSNLQKLLMQKIGRPTARTTVIPLHFLSHHPFETGILNPMWLVVESTVKEAQINDLIDYCLERLEPLRSSIERVLIEVQLENSAQMWETSFTQFSDALALVDKNFNVLIGNRKYHSLGEKKLAKCYEHLAGLNYPCENCPLMHRAAEQTTSVVLKGKSFELTSARISMGSKDNEFFIHRYRDVSDERMLAAKMIQSEKWMALGKLSNHVAHELNNPLTGIKMSIQLLKKSVSVEHQQLLQDLLEVEKATSRSLQLIAGLRTFVSGEAKVAFISVDEVITNTLPLLKTALRSIRVETDLRQSQPKVFANPHLLGQVVFNLVYNATQALKGTVQPVVQIHSEERAKDVIFWVIDNGPGISPAIEDKIFEPFFTTKSAEEGTGIGLSLCRQIVEKFSGEIGFFRPAAGGAAFWVRFPKSQESP